MTLGKTACSTCGLRNNDDFDAFNASINDTKGNSVTIVVDQVEFL